MQHIFVINPHAGKIDSTNIIREKVERLDKVIDYDIYVTQCAGDATRFVARWRAGHPLDDVRFYACGGDGTLNEVVSGIMQANASREDTTQTTGPLTQLTCYPCGSGNDYVKYYPGDFLNLNDLVGGIPHQVDVMKVSSFVEPTDDHDCSSTPRQNTVSENSDHYSINVCNVGFEAKVCKTMNDVKRKPIIGGERAYTTGVIKNLFCGMKNYCRLTVDGTSFYDGDMLLCSFSNGRYVGGGYQCAPLSVNDDGLIEVLLFKPIHIPFFARMISVYRNGKQFEDPRFKKVIRYSQAKNVTITSDKPFDLCIDGEMLLGTHFKIQNLCKAVTFVSPLSN